MAVFVGRTEPLDRLVAAYRALTAEPHAIARGARLVLVTGEAGIGKTTLLRRFAAAAAAAGGVVVWGSAWDGQAPAWWPWTQALRALVGRGDALRDSPAELAAILPELGPAVPDGDAGRVRVFDAVDRLLAWSAGRTPVVVVLDDLHWADPSTVDLIRFLIRPGRASVLLVGAYRPHELDPDVAVGIAELAAVAEPIALRVLAASEVAELVTAIGGSATRPDWIPVVVERSGGHPFLAREVCHLLAAGRGPTEIPTAVREVVRQRVARLPAGCAELLEAAALASTELRPGVLADVTGMAAARVTELIEAATAASLVADGRFVHDLYRETIVSTLGPTRRLELHARVATALLDRHARGGAVLPAELAGHLAAGVPLLGSEPALWWARVAAEADTRRFAFAEAAGHLARVREAVADTGAGWTEADLVDLLTAEADLRLRSGDADAARRLLDTAWIRAVATEQADLLGSVALGHDRLGARFAMPRAELVAVLDAAATALDGAGTADEALVLAALARQWQHSVPAERRRARPLAERSVAIARSIDDPATLARCLLAEHDTRWTPGTASARAAIAAEIAGLAQRAGDPERHAQALLLLATAQLENGSPAFRVTLREHQYLTEQLHEPRHDYVRLTRQAALALLDGDVEAGDALSAEAAVLGEAVGDSDTGNVRMSQRLEIVRARGHAEELLATAADAVRWWVGAPAHAHAVAAGFRARAGDLAGARRELDTGARARLAFRSLVPVVRLRRRVDRGGRRTRRPSTVSTAPRRPVTGCRHRGRQRRARLLHGFARPPRRAAVRRPRRRGPGAALVRPRVGGTSPARRPSTWEAETAAALAALADRPRIELRRVGDMWFAAYGGESAYLRDCKGLHDLATLLARPRVDVPAIELAGGAAPVESSDSVLDGRALAAYRRRLAELDDELAAADLGRHQRAGDEREALLGEIRRATRPDGSARPLGLTARERARKAVTARIRDALARVTDTLPEFGAHLDRTIRTGTTCRYDP